jgi:hypothetical protein
VLLDDQFRWLEIDLLNDQSLLAIETQLSTTTGTTVQGMSQEKIDLVSGEQGAFVQGMARLATGFAFVPSSRQSRGRLDDVRRGGLGGSRGVFPRGGELLLQTSHGRLQLLELHLQPLASDTGIHGGFGHARFLSSICLIAQLWA